MRATLVKMRRTIISSSFERKVALGSSGPIVSFSFDDFPRSALGIGGELLKSFGARGTYYAAIGLMNSVTELGEQFRREDLESLLRDGHELGHHTFGHISCRSVTARSFREEVKKGRTAIEELTGYCAPNNFAYPFGEVTLRAKRLVGADVASSRGIWPGFNGPVADLSLLRANSLYGDRTSCHKVQELILENERRRSWIIFYSHDVQCAPSRYGCTPELLEFAVCFALQRKARVLTIADVIAELVSQPREKEHSLVSLQDRSRRTAQNAHSGSSLSSFESGISR